MLPALVLTAGLGTRLRPLTLVRAKPAVPIAGEPIVRHIIRWLRGAGISDLVLNLHHLPETIASLPSATAVISTSACVIPGSSRRCSALPEDPGAPCHCSAAERS
jgi:CTP:molybdopterin cytidylyltransferase MocA